MLVIDTEKETTSMIDSGVKGDFKWLGIKAWGAKKLFCAPFNASGPLVIDLEKEECRVLETSLEGTYKCFELDVVGETGRGVAMPLIPVRGLYLHRIPHGPYL